MKTFKQIFIRSEADLPKEDGDYFGMSKGRIGGYDVFYLDSDTRPYWTEEVEWYLIEAPDNRDAIIEKQRELIDYLFIFVNKGSMAEKVARKKQSELSALEAPPKDNNTPSICTSCGHQNSENCNTCSVINPQFE